MDGCEYALAAYREIAELDSAHGIRLVQHIVSRKIYVKKVLEVYSRPVYDYLMQFPVRNMPQILEAVEEDGKLIVIEEYIPGDTLQYLLDNRGPFSEAEVLPIALQLCRIVRELHNAEPAIIHRDIKPGNIILTEDGIVKLLDMNAAKQYSPEHQNDTRLMGTVGFAAPEQYGFTQSSVKTDIYSVGAVINMLLTGQLPTAQLSDSRLKPIIRRCCEIAPKDRYAGMDELIRELELLMPGRRAEAEVPDWMRYLPPGFRSGSLPAIALALLGYCGVFWLTASLTVENASPGELFLNRLAFCTIFIGIIFFSGNYLNIHARLPLTRSRNALIRLIGILLYDAVILFAVLSLLAAAIL